MTVTDEQSAVDTGGDEKEEKAQAFFGAARWAIIFGTLVSFAVAIWQLFNLGNGFDVSIAGTVLFEVPKVYTFLDNMYLYVLATVFLALSFLCLRIDGSRDPNVPWFDWLLSGVSICTGFFFVVTAETSLESAWEYAAPDEAVWVATLFYLLILEATRRAGGWIVFGIVAVFSVFPTFAGFMPDPLNGLQSPLPDTIVYHMVSEESSFGIPMRAFGTIVIGFLFFGAALQYTGGGRFFNQLALALVGGYRGGAAKVAVFASGFMGSMSGSVVSNVLSTGAVSIPAMKQTGFSPRYAAATEACASTGGVLMPPIMGATAFLIASWLSMPYVEVMLAAAIPSALYYFGLFSQIDAYAARHGLRGMARDRLPSIVRTLRSGWIYIFVFALLITLMVAFRWETTAPFYSVAALLIVNQFMPDDRFTWSEFLDMIVKVGRNLTELVAVLLGIGMIMGSFQYTGVTSGLANELIALAGDSVILLLIMGAITSFVFGMGMTVTACYVVLAVILAPALVQAGLNELAVHLFILYWGMVSYITPPVALGAFAAATMAGASAMRTGLEAMRLGGVIYIAPFFFVLNPALIGDAGTLEVIAVLCCALLGIWFLSAAMQGYVSFIGRFPDGGTGLALRLLLAIAGFMIAAPAGGIAGLSHVTITLSGMFLALLPLAICWRTDPKPQAI